MAPAYKLIYFNSKGAAESIRFLLAYGGIEYEDVRVSKEEWPQIKDSYVFGQLPVLEFDGKQINQSIAITRFIGKKVNLAGKTDEENLEIDALVDTFGDIKTKFRPIFVEQDAEKKKAATDNFFKETYPYFFERFEKIVAKNGGHLVGGRLTWADVVMVCNNDMMQVISKNTAMLEKYPNLKKLQEKVMNIPAIKKWVESRPVTPF